MENIGKNPRWKHATIYPSFDAPEYAQDKALLHERIQTLLGRLGDPLSPEGFWA
ncbi:MAG: hypothetical protein LBP88_08560 [Treponema sp.]|nr:hypothetical protein [Treponema sp.]